MADVTLAALLLVGLAGLVTALATGLGALPFFVIDEMSDRLNVTLWGLASGIMLAASLFGLVREGLAEADRGPRLLPVGEYSGEAAVVIGLLAGVALVIVAHEVVESAEVNPRQYEAADFRKLVLILGVLTVHSFPEGVAIGVAFADLNIDGVALFGFTVPLLAVFMTVAISVHNVPEGIAVSIPLRSMGVPNWRLVWWAVFSSLPQPIGAVLAFYFVRLARAFLPVGFGFAAGAMIYLVLTEFVPEALAEGADLPGGGYRELVAGLVVGVALMVPLAFV